MAVEAETQQAPAQAGPTAALRQRVWSYLRASVVTYPVARRRQLVAETLHLVGIPAVFTVLWFIEPPPTLVGAHQALGLPPCTMRALFHIPCPGCGGTTGIILLLHGQIRMAFLASLLAPPIFVGLIGLWIQSAYSVITSRRVLWLRDPGAARTATYTILYVLIAWAYKIVTYFYVMERIHQGTWPL